MNSGWKTLAVHPFTINLLALEVSCCLVPRYSQVNARHTKVSLSVWLKTWMKWYSFKEGKSAVFHCSSILNGDQFFKNRLCSHLSKIFPSWVDPFWKSFLIQRSKQESKNFPHLSKWPTSMKVVEWPRICKYVKFCLRWQSLSGYLHLNSLHKKVLYVWTEDLGEERHTLSGKAALHFSVLTPILYR